MGLERLYSYQEIDGDITKEFMLKKKKSYGYKTIEPFKYDRSYAELNDSILKDNEIISSGFYSRCSTDKKYVKNSIRLWKDLDVRLHKVLFFTETSGMRLVHPSDIPVKLIVSNEGYTLATSRLFEYDYYTTDSTDGVILCNDDGIDMDENGVIMDKIELPIIGNRITSCCYNHEIAHTQLVSVKGSCLDILNSETLPIFIGEVFASIMDKSGNLIKTLRNDSLLAYAENIYAAAVNPQVSFEDRIDYDMYNKSILQAIALSNIYISGSSEIKKEIHSYIGKIFDGERTVEDMLDKYEANAENVSKDLAVLKKTM